MPKSCHFCRLDISYIQYLDNGKRRYVCNVHRRNKIKKKILELHKTTKLTDFIEYDYDDRMSEHYD